MKKIFGISLVAVLMAMPMMANAVPVAGDPGATTSGAGTAGSAPKYALKNAGDDDGNAATAAYIKGAYNAIIKGVNKTHDEVVDLQSDITTYRNAIGQLTTGKATQSGTVATIKDATTNESIATSSVNITGVTTSSISATASGNINLTVPVMGDWANDSAGNNIQTTTSFSGLAVNGLSMSAPTSNTATLTKTGISGTVNVVEYLANAGFDFTTLISPSPQSYGYMSADGSYSNNADGLSNGEWKVTWNDYGTAQGASKCSTTRAAENQTGNPADTAGGGCWCKLTGFTDNNNTTYNQSSFWMYDYSEFASASDCASECAMACGYSTSSSSSKRSAMFRIGGTVDVADGSAYNYTVLISKTPNGFGYKSADGGDINNADGLANGEWKVTWNVYGTARGTSKCSATGGSFGTAGNPSDTDGDGCWCKLTGFTDNDNTTYNQSSLWVFDHTFGSASDCASECATYCGYFISSDTAMRSGLFGSVQQ